MKKWLTALSTAGILLILVLFLSFLYFSPLPMSDLAKKDHEILVTMTKIGVRNGEAYIDCENYNALTREQQNQIRNAFRNHSYRRRFSTPLSDGAMDGLGEEHIQIYIYDDLTLVHSIFLSPEGDVMIDAKNYRMKDAEEIFEEIKDALRIE